MPYSNNNPRIWFVGAARCGAPSHLLTANPMETLNSLLLDILGWNKTHGWALHRLANRFGIDGIVFIGLDVRFDELRCNHPHRMSHLGETTDPVMGATARFKTD